MKLLSKNQVNIEASINRKRQIEEGVTIARKVDALRLSLVDLERQKGLFIENNVKEIQNKIGPLSQKLKNLQEEVVIAEGALKQARMPLDAEWEILEKEKRFIVNGTLELEERKKVLQQEYREIEKTKSNLASLEKKQNLFLEEIQSNALVSRKDRKEAEKVLRLAKNKLANQNSIFEEKLCKLEETKKSYRLGVIRNKQQEERLKDKEVFLNEKEREINDKYETLLRIK